MYTQEELTILYRTNDEFARFVHDYIRKHPEYSVTRALRMKEVKDCAGRFTDDRK